MTDNRAGRIENRQQYQDNRVDRRDEVRDQVHDNHPDSTSGPTTLVGPHGESIVPIVGRLGEH